MTDQPRTIYLADYQPFSHLVTGVDLTFTLAPRATRVLARVGYAPNPARGAGLDLRLDGENLTLIRAAIDGAPVTLTPDATGLTVPASLLPDGPFTLETLVEISPETNTALEGLYMSNGMYCTQCEAEGFRKITFYPDRPDVMATFRVRIESDLPVLLSNGNPAGQGAGWAEWHDPWPKPAYLFALVAGDLVAHSGQFTTRSGRDVALHIWVRAGDETRCAYALDSLIRSMKWDEETYGREYDLDVFNIVAVDDFNMGAMENKGLNIFNSKYVLADAASATDDDFANIEGIIAHEYFHNWTGNRITCRDWFQLCLKEGLTVFRDQQFSSDMRSAAVKRIEDVMVLRARQFREDAGPLAHPPRPDSFVEINNFYTATVYRKGAEVIGMLKQLVGDDGYARALDLYFDRHDGQACTIEDWLKVFQDATGRDLTQFKRWYTEAGTPRLTVEEDWDGETYALTIEQHNPATPGQPDKGAKLIPVALGLLNPNGDEVLPTTILELSEPRQTWRFPAKSRPVPSILRGFSAPVVIDRTVTPAERAFLLAHDTDPFNRFESGRALAKSVLANAVTGVAGNQADWLAAMERLVTDESLDAGFRALALRLPAEDDMAATLAEGGVTPDPDRIHTERQAMGQALAARLAPHLAGLMAEHAAKGPFTPDAAGAGRRALVNACLMLQSRLDGGAAARAAYARADNMTDQIGALSALLNIGQGQAELDQFAARWSGDGNVMDKWFSLQLVFAAPDGLIDLAHKLMQHPAYSGKNPNRFRAVIGSVAANHAGFHHASGQGYDFVADQLAWLDPQNPQTAARMSTVFDTWTRYDADRRALAQGALSRMAATAGISRDLGEMVGRMLAAGR